MEIITCLPHGLASHHKSSHFHHQSWIITGRSSRTASTTVRFLNTVISFCFSPSDSLDWHQDSIHPYKSSAPVSLRIKGQLANTGSPENWPLTLVVTNSLSAQQRRRYIYNIAGVHRNGEVWRAKQQRLKGREKEVLWEGMFPPQQLGGWRVLLSSLSMESGAISRQPRDLECFIGL